jgi:anhydro-N-acetylmuramic acid kinase
MKPQINSKDHGVGYRVLGLMSGSSLDGIDWCMANFEVFNAKWSFQIEGCGLLPYSSELVERLTCAHLLPVHEAMLLQHDFGKISTAAAQAGIEQFGEPLLIAEHGHTLVHRPELGYTWQMTAAPMLAARFRVPVVGDFRRVDVALGGQGAPLVPYGDALLFSEYAACLNLGGIANLSFDEHGKRIGFDVCFANQVLNRLAQNLGLPFDQGGSLAANARNAADETKRSRVDSALSEWADIDFLRPFPPPSLGRETLETDILPRLTATNLSSDDLLWAWCAHIAQCVSHYLQFKGIKGRILVTGGGAFNQFLMDCLRASASTGAQCHWETGSVALITHKEALLFGFFGLLRYLGLPNVDGCYTGSAATHSAGCVYHPFP